jgi:hypothetical protein
MASAGSGACGWRVRACSAEATCGRDFIFPAAIHRWSNGGDAISKTDSKLFILTSVLYAHGYHSCQQSSFHDERRHVIDATTTANTAATSEASDATPSGSATASNAAIRQAIVHM